jgi:hypothetical protein
MANRRCRAVGVALLALLLAGTVAVPTLHDTAMAQADAHSHSDEAPSQVVATCPVCDSHLAPAFPVAIDFAPPERPLKVASSSFQPTRLHEPGCLARHQARAPPTSS